MKSWRDKREAVHLHTTLGTLTQTVHAEKRTTQKTPLRPIKSKLAEEKSEETEYRKQSDKTNHETRNSKTTETQTKLERHKRLFRLTANHNGGCMATG